MKNYNQTEFAAFLQDLSGRGYVREISSSNQLTAACREVGEENVSISLKAYSPETRLLPALTGVAGSKPKNVVDATFQVGEQEVNAAVSPYFLQFFKNNGTATVQPAVMQEKDGKNQMAKAANWNEPRVFAWQLSNVSQTVTPNQIQPANVE